MEDKIKFVSKIWHHYIELSLRPELMKIPYPGADCQTKDHDKGEMQRRNVINMTHPKLKDSATDYTDFEIICQSFVLQNKKSAGPPPWVG